MRFCPHPPQFCSCRFPADFEKPKNIKTDSLKRELESFRVCQKRARGRELGYEMGQVSGGADVWRRAGADMHEEVEAWLCLGLFFSMIYSGRVYPRKGLVLSELINC